MNIEHRERAHEISASAANAINTIFENNKRNPILFLTSGGSSFDVLEHVVIPVGSKISVGVLDERYSANPTVNNFIQFKNTQFFQRSENLFEHILDTSVQENESLDSFSDRYEAMLQTWMVENHNGVIVATIGMGPDGHVSGMMPFPEDSSRFEALFNGHKLVIGYDAGKKNQFGERATTTLEFMRRIHYGIGYIVGENKKDAWNRVIAEKGSLAETPARILREMEDVRVFTDL